MTSRMCVIIEMVLNEVESEMEEEQKAIKMSVYPFVILSSNFYKCLQMHIFQYSYLTFLSVIMVYFFTNLIWRP